ncbi:MAG TPA: hypothetical protein VMM60_01530, partial [Ilumatobacter sp.]|nr:hypothetical protein [Ilumatobacter sp.]
SHVVRHDYPMYVQSPDAELVAENTFDACEYLMRVQADGESGLETDFVGPVPTHITYYPASHLRAHGEDQPTTDLLRLTGATVRTVGADVGDTGWWGLRSGHEDIASSMAERLAQAIAAAGETGATTVVSDSVCASLAIAEQTGTLPLHPLQLVARAYGIAKDQPLDEA